mmetsp:Transcript_93785/g.186010  ORF Transcript_93785/g.186010 Transcript_93785/m.186010 type:complete len:296 (-) Transcript_93785:1669-2556(-)
MCSTVPAFGATIVSSSPSSCCTSAMGSPFWTSSPTSTFHSLKIPSPNTGAIPGLIVSGGNLPTTTRESSSHTLSISSPGLRPSWRFLMIPVSGVETLKSSFSSVWRVATGTPFSTVSSFSTSHFLNMLLGGALTTVPPPFAASSPISSSMTAMVRSSQVSSIGMPSSSSFWCDTMTPSLVANTSWTIPLSSSTFAMGSFWETSSPVTLTHSLNLAPLDALTPSAPRGTSKERNFCPTTRRFLSYITSSIFMPGCNGSWRCTTSPAISACSVLISPCSLVTSATGSPSSTCSPTSL